jgi:hypothetical protein
LAAATNAGRLPTMKATVTKKRRRKADGNKPPKSKKKIKEDKRLPTSDDSDDRIDVESDGSDAEVTERAAPCPS